MLTHPISRQLWSKIAPLPARWFRDNISLLAKMSLTIKAKAGRPEARTFIQLCRVASLME